MTARSIADLGRLGGALAPLDRHFARTVARLVGEEDSWVLLGAALASRVVGEGSVCVDLAEQASRPVVGEDGAELADLRWPAAEAWAERLGASALTGDGTGPEPLVLDSAGRLYLARYWRYEQQLAGALRRRAVPREDDVPPPVLDRVLEQVGRGASDEQVDAVRRGLTRHLTVVTGGPGTGKTTTVVRLIAALHLLASEEGLAPPRVALAAPTGKAAAALLATTISLCVLMARTAV